MEPVGNEPGNSNQVENLLRLVSTDWRERQAAVEALARENQVELIARVLKLVQQDHTHLNVLSPALQVLQQAGQPVLDELIQLLYGPDRELRIYIPIILSRLGGPQAVDALIQAASDAHQPDNVRFNAIEGLGNLQAPAAVDLLHQILQSGNAFLKYSALIALGQIGPPAAPARDTIRALLADPFLSEPALMAFAQVCEEPAPQGAETVAAWLAQPAADPGQAIAALGVLARRSADPALVETSFLARLDPAGIGQLSAFLQDLDLPATTSADLALICGWLVKADPARSAKWAQLKQQAGHSLVQLLSVEAASQAAQSALMGQQFMVLDELIDAASSLNNLQARAAIRLLGAAVQADAGRADSAAGPQPAAGVQPADAAHLMNAPHPSDAPHTGVIERIRSALFDALESEDDALAALAVEALGKTGDPQAISAIWDQLEHRSLHVRSAAIRALAGLDRAVLTARAIPWLADPDPQRRVNGLVLLFESHHPQAGAALQTALEDPVPDVRKAAIQILPRLSGADAAQRLQQFMTDTDPEIRRASLQAAAQLEPAAAQPIYLRAVEDPSSWIRLYAIKFLANHPTPATLPILLRSADDDLAPVRNAALQGLARALDLPLDPAMQAAVRAKLQENATKVE